MYGGTYLAQTYFGQAYPGLVVGVPEWVSPANHATNQIGTAPLVFTIPPAVNILHFELQLDTANTFNTGSLQTIQSWAAQTGWEYWDNSAWVAIPLTGVDPTYAGNQARYRPSSDLAVGTWYRRIRARTKA